MTAPAIPLPELSELVRLHARAQGLDPATCDRILASVDTVDPGRGGWPATWSHLARRSLEAGRPLEAARLYSLARFPYAGDAERAQAARAGVEAFDAWRRRVGGIDRLELALPGGEVACWAARLHRGRPLLLVMGGIVSVKEQWAPFLRAADRLGVAVVVTEMPSVGENTLVHGPESVDLIPRLLDALGPTNCAAGVQVVGLSFAGQLALHAARHDPRIVAVHTVGAPVSGITDPEVWATLPRTTTATLAHLTRTPPERTRELLAPLALADADLAALDVPVRYVASRRDEIIPRREWERLAEHVPDFGWVEFDDVHGSPAHLTDTRLWLVREVMAVLGDRRGRALSAALALRGNASRSGRTLR
jgi:esterase FrsA